MKRIIIKVAVALLILCSMLVPQSAQAMPYKVIDNPPKVNLTLLDGYKPFDDGIITFEELVDEVKNNPDYAKFDDKQWDLLITQRGINHVDDKLLDEFIQQKPKDLTELYTQYADLLLKNPTKDQLTQIDTSLAKLTTQKAPLTASLTTAKSDLQSKSATTDKAVLTAVVQEAANAVAKVDGKISEISQPLQVPDQMAECERAIASIKEKFACAINEQRLRESGTKRDYIHSTYYLDFTAHSGHLTGTVTFTNGSATVTGDGSTLFTTELANNDYVRVSNGTQWYKVTARAANNSMTISPAFQQSNVTDGAGATYISASATQDGTTTTKAFCHLNRYTTDTTRTAGDILKVRANQTNTQAGINNTFDESGTVTSYIEIRGCSVADDPFSDASNVQPIFNFGNTAFYLNESRDYWRIFNLEVTNNNSTSGLVTLGGLADIVDTLTIHLNNNASGVGVLISAGGLPQLLNCSIYDNSLYNYNDSVGTGDLFMSGCSLNGGSVKQSSYAIRVANGMFVRIKDSTIGTVTTHGTAAILVARATPIEMRNTQISDATRISGASYSTQISYEDDGQVLGAQSAWYYSGTVTKSSTVLRTGGGSSSALLLPSSVVTIKYPLNIAYGSLNPDFAVWCPASATTVTVYMRANTIWATYPTAAQLFIQADYWASGASIRSQSTASTQTLTDTREPSGAGTYTADAGTNTTTVVDAGLAGTTYVGKYLYNSTRSAGAEITTYNDGTKTIGLGSAIASQTTGDTYYILDWVGFTTTFTPGTAGWVYIKCNLGLYAAGKGVYIDCKPATS